MASESIRRGFDRRDRSAVGNALGLATLGLVGVVVLVQFAARVVSRVLPVGPFLRLAMALDRLVRRQVLASTTIARRSGVRLGQRVLLLGAVDGRLLDAFSRLVGRDGRVEALALEDGGLARARIFLSNSRVENANVMPGDGRGLPFEDLSFDAVCLVSALGRVPEPRKVFGELWRVLRPAGRLSASDVASDPSFRLASAALSLGEASGFEPFEQFGNAFAYTVNFRKPRDRSVAR